MSKYDEFATHPRYGRHPRVTGSNPESDYEGGIYLHWHSPSECRVPNTAVIADLERQSPATVPITHYFDVERRCRDCGRGFIFFALEQKYWYEQLGFPLESDCVRCPGCRKEQQWLARTRERYEALSRIAEPNEEQSLELVGCYVCLAEESMARPKQVPRMRGILKRLASEPNIAPVEQVEDLLKRLKHLEPTASERDAARDVQRATRAVRK